MAKGFRHASKRILEKSAAIRNDVRESTDANLLALLRLFGLLYGPIDRRARIDRAFRGALGYRLAPQAGWRHALGGIAYFLLMVLVVTGVLLAFYYRPSAQEAYPSLQHIVSSIPFGWLVRDVHAWAASLVVIVVLVHMLRSYVEATYKAPRETNWLAGFLLLAVLFGFGISGYLLPWDQWSYWTVAEAMDAVGRVPVLGRLVVELVRGDDAVSGATLSRLFAFHVILLPWLLLGLVVLHFALVRKHGQAPVVYRARYPERRMRFYPDQLMRILATAAVTLAVVITLAVLFPRNFGPHADPSAPPDLLPSTWVVVPFWRALLHLLGWGAPVVMVGLGVLLLLLPLLDRTAEVHLRHRRVAMVIGALCVGTFVVALVTSPRLRTHGPQLTVPTGAEAPAVPFGGAERVPLPVPPDTTTAGGGRP